MGQVLGVEPSSPRRPNSVIITVQEREQQTQIMTLTVFLTWQCILYPSIIPSFLSSRICWELARWGTSEWVFGKQFCVAD